MPNAGDSIISPVAFANVTTQKNGASKELFHKMYQHPANNMKQYSPRECALLHSFIFFCA
jgi:hypothetical protein